MAYAISAADITKLYLYGSTSVPNDLTSLAVPNLGPAPPQQLDTQQYMTLGAGRFGRPSQFSAINLFFLNENGPFNDPTGLGKSFTLADAIQLTGVSLNSAGNYVETVNQALYQDGKDDLIERTFVIGTSRFILKNATFVIGPNNSSRHIENLEIVPEVENFDFFGGDISNAANSLLGLENNIDPWRIGDQVIVKFTGSSYIISNYSFDDWQADRSYLSLGGSFDPVDNLIEGLLSDLTDDLFNQGITRFIHDGKAIVYGNRGGGAVDAGDRINEFHQEAFDTGGIVFVGSNGNDDLTGVSDKASILNGNGGDDTFESGLGADVINGGDGTDTAKYLTSVDGVYVDLVANTGSGGSAEGDAFTDIENVSGSNLNDRIMGSDLVNKLEGGIGNDVLVGGAGIDKLYGGVGSDLLIVGGLTDSTGSNPTADQEIAEGGEGDDYIVLSDSGSSEIVLNDGDRTDHLLLMPHMVGKSAGEGGSLELFALTGGVAYYADYYLHPYGGGIASVTPGSNEGENKVKSYHFEHEELATNSVGLVISENKPPFYLNYYWTKALHKLEITVHSYDASNADAGLHITINDWSPGDYGIVLQEFNLGDIHVYDDDYSKDYNTLSVGQVNAAIRSHEKDGERYVLTNKLEFQPSAFRMFASEFTAPAIPTELTLENLAIQINGTVENNVLTGTERDELIFGQDGNDRLLGKGGDDTISGDAGNDVLIGGLGADALDGGDGIDTADYRDSVEGVEVDLQFGLGLGGTAAGDKLSNIETVQGSAFDDAIHGDDGANRLFGNQGADTLDGGLGNDVLVGGIGADALNGGDGIDTADYRPWSVGVSVDLALGTGGDGDTLLATESVQGSQFADLISGDGSVNRLYGNDGNDILSGGDSNDLITGGLGADQIIGGAGDLDLADYRAAAAAVTLSLVTGGTASEAQGDTYSGVEYVYGSNI